MLPNTYSPCGRSFPTGFRLLKQELMQYNISQSDNNACDILIEYAGGIKHINDYIRRLVSTPSTSRKQKTTCTPASGCIPQLEYSFRYGPTTENGR